MATINIEIDIDPDGITTVTPNPATVGDGDTVRWHINSNAHGSGAISVRLPPGTDSPFGNTDNRLEVGVEKPRRCNLLEPATEPVNWPPGTNSYSYDVEFSGSPVISAVSGRLIKREASRIEYPKFPDDIQEVYLLPANPVIGQPLILSSYRKIYPVHWWKRWYHQWWPFSYHRKECCCCCCCDNKTASPPVILPPQPNVIAAPTIVLTQAMLPIGGLFYLLITPQGNRCQFVVQWAAAGGVGQLTVDLDVQDPGSASFRRLASGLGPADQYTFVGNRNTYLFRATVTDSRGQSTFDTLSVTCP